MSLHPSIAGQRQTILAAAARHGVRDVRVFGSMARGDPGPDSDVDLLVELDEGRDLFDLGALLMELQDTLGRRVDILTERSLHPALRGQILNEAVRL